MILTPSPQEVYGTYRFWIEIDGLLTAGFTEVSGLQSEVETQEYNEGGLNQYVHHFPKKIKYPALVLKRGISKSDELWNWYDGVFSGKGNRKNGSIILMDRSGSEACRWNFYEAFPVKWSGPEFNATSNNVGIEALELRHNGLKAIYK